MCVSAQPLHLGSCVVIAWNLKISWYPCSFFIKVINSTGNQSCLLYLFCHAVGRNKWRTAFPTVQTQLISWLFSLFTPQLPWISPKAWYFFKWHPCWKKFYLVKHLWNEWAFTLPKKLYRFQGGVLSLFTGYLSLLVISFLKSLLCYIPCPLNGWRHICAWCCSYT